MAAETRGIELAEIEDFAALVEEVRRTGQPRILRHDGRDVAVLAPAPSTRRGGGRSARLRPPTEDEMARSRAGIEAAAGSWADIDVKAFEAELRRQRSVSTRPPVTL